MEFCYHVPSIFSGGILCEEWHLETTPTLIVMKSWLVVLCSSLISFLKLTVTSLASALGPGTVSADDFQ